MIKNENTIAPSMMRRALLLVILLCTMPLSSVIAGVPAPNDNGMDDGEAYTLSVDGYVTTKFASVGSNVEIFAMTRGHTDETIVTADILRYPTDPMAMLTSSGMMADEGILIDRVVLTSSGPHEEDADAKGVGIRQDIADTVRLQRRERSQDQSHRQRGRQGGDAEQKG